MGSADGWTVDPRRKTGTGVARPYLAVDNRTGKFDDATVV
jgi:hypothetical protein